MMVVALAIIKSTSIALLGYYLYKKDYINTKVLDFLIFFVINFAVPCLAFAHLVENLKVNTQPSLGVFLLLSIIIFVISFLVGLLFSFRKSHEFKREFISLVSFQNSGYLPMNIALFLFPPVLRETFLVYIFLYILGFDIIMWSIGSFFIFKKKEDEFKIKSILTPPIISIALALVLVYTGGARFLPDIFIGPVKMVGETSFVLSMIIVGCWLARVELNGLYKKLLIILEASFAKLVILPSLFLFIVVKLDVTPLLGLFIILQAAMPSAVSLPIVVNLRNADSEFVSQGVLVTHLISIITVPLWLGLYVRLTHFSF
ncbi:MAG: AEC family transporter [Candidatus Omnitrophota bacterium]